jgi:hypothetical protein
MMLDVAAEGNALFLAKENDFMIISLLLNLLLNNNFFMNRAYNTK